MTTSDARALLRLATATPAPDRAALTAVLARLCAPSRRRCVLRLASASNSKQTGGHGDAEGDRHGGRARSAGDLGSYLKEQRETARLSLRQLATAAGVSNPYLSQIERGLRKPSAEVLQQIAKGLQISAEALFLRAGILEESEGLHVEVAIQSDLHLTARQKRVLLDIYTTFRAENARADAVDGTDRAAGEPAAAAEPDGDARPRRPATAARKAAVKKTAAKKATAKQGGGQEGRQTSTAATKAAVKRTRSGARSAAATSAARAGADDRDPDPDRA